MEPFSLVLHFINTTTFVASIFGSGEARRGSILRSGAVTEEQRSQNRKATQPSGRRFFSAQTSLLAPYRPLKGMRVARASSGPKILRRKRGRIYETEYLALTATVAPANKFRATANPTIRPILVIFVFIFGLSILDMGSWAGSRVRPRAPFGAFELSCLLPFAGFRSVFHPLLRRTPRGALAHFLAEAHRFLPAWFSVNFRMAGEGEIESRVTFGVTSPLNATFCSALNSVQ